MSDPEFQNDKEALDHTIVLVEAALDQCDQHGFIFPAIDISSALDKLIAMRDAPAAQ